MQVPPRSKSTSEYDESLALLLKLTNVGGAMNCQNPSQYCCCGNDGAARLVREKIEKPLKHRRQELQTRVYSRSLALLVTVFANFLICVVSELSQRMLRYCSRTQSPNSIRGTLPGVTLVGSALPSSSDEAAKVFLSSFCLSVSDDVIRQS